MAGREWPKKQTIFWQITIRMQLFNRFCVYY